jgi:gliding motility-associated-like protein
LLCHADGQNLLSIKIFPTSKLNCVNSPITFGSIVNDVFPGTPETLFPTTYTWSVLPANGIAHISDIHSPTLSLTFSTAITCSVFLKIGKGENGAITFTNISVGFVPKASFNATFLNVGYPNQLQLTSFSTNSLVNNWHFSDTPTIDTTANTIKSYSASGSYSVMLVTFGQTGCSDTVRYNFYLVDSSGITLPNIFTPNNDNINDIYKPIAKGISKLSAKIYNRYAVLIHNWDSVNGFWDGQTNSGEPCSDGEYFIILNATGFDGKTYQLHSHITLIR